MRNAYKAYRHKLHLAYKNAGGDGFAESDGHLEAFTSIEYELLQAGQPCDPVTFFRRTHDPEKKINAKCKDVSEKMKAMKEAADRGETNDTPEETFNKVRNPGCSGKRRRKAHPTNYSLYQKKEEEMAELKVRMASLEQENKRLKKETGLNATKKWLNEYLVKVGMPAMELSSEDDAEDDDEDADMHRSQIHEHRDAFEGSDMEAEEEAVEAFGEDQEEGDEENPDRELEEDDE
ncbi:histone H2A.Z-specific chaperone CHZ1-like [Papaver somniferum]|uniref:histone H2A.Z-specific chaperone CHZ1-like n=1 Tax=Papaver somniferum TaxID=3469 RepID=UPI000E702DA7|nr:histone H2A.Z-specific chaperone CHZ1-like [Papaver somniferum]